MSLKATSEIPVFWEKQLVCLDESEAFIGLRAAVATAVIDGFDDYGVGWDPFREVMERYGILQLQYSRDTGKSTR